MLRHEAATCLGTRTLGRAEVAMQYTRIEAESAVATVLGLPFSISIVRIRCQRMSNNSPGGLTDADHHLEGDSGVIGMLQSLSLEDNNITQDYGN